MAMQVTLTAADAWRQAVGVAVGLRNNLPGWGAQLSAENHTVEQIFGLYSNLKKSRDALENYKTAPNLTAHVADLLGQPAYDAVAEINAVTSAIQDAMDWVDTNASGLSLNGDTAANWLASGSVASNRFGPPATAGLRALLTAIEATIEAA